MFENLLMAFYLSGGGSFEAAPDVKDGYGTRMHVEPRYTVGAGFSFDVSDRVEVDMGYRWTDMPPLPGRAHDTLDKSHTAYLEVRIRPFRK
jgi:opacity protein-like surface antigen